MKYSALGIPVLLFVGILLVSCSAERARFQSVFGCGAGLSSHAQKKVNAQQNPIKTPVVLPSN
jgi:hypothetical protein